jgi:biopolymer transport protein ExbD
MSRLETNLARLRNGVWSVPLLVVATALSGTPQISAQAMQKGISVELAPTSNSVPVPGADNEDALIVTVTDAGRLYFGIDPVTPDSLAGKLKGRTSRPRALYIKVDARAPYASLVKVLDAARTAGVAAVTLLTTQPKTAQPGAVVSPEGIEIELARPSPAATK